jgi:competence protein ComEA
LVAIVALIGAGVGIEGYLRPVYVSDPLPAVESRSGEIAGRINPNTATAAELSSIPQVGPSRAAAIIAYREQYVAGHPGDIAFKRPEDLRNVKGFGAAMVEKVGVYLEFGE